MRNNFIRNLLMFGLMAMGSFNAQAQIINVNKSAGNKLNAKTTLTPKIDKSKVYLATANGDNEIYLPNVKKENDQSDDGKFTVTCQINYVDSLYYTFGTVKIVNKDYNDQAYTYTEDQKHTVECKVPAGTYDFITFGLPIIGTALDGSVSYVVKEQVNITKDTTLVLDYATSNKFYKAKVMKPNGDEFKIDEMSGVIDSYLLVLKGKGLVSEYLDQGNILLGKHVGVYLNDVSDRYKLCLNRDIVMNNENYICKCENTSMADTILANTPNDYVLYTEKFTPSPGYNPELGAGTVAYDVLSMIDNEEQSVVSCVTGIVTNDSTLRFNMDTPKSSDESDCRFDMLISPHFGDQKVLPEDDGDEDNAKANGVIRKDLRYYDVYIDGLPVLVTKDGVEYINASHDECGDNSFHLPENGGSVVDYPGHPAFSYTDKQKEFNYGTSCPINALMIKNRFDDYVQGKYMTFICTYIGRNGELRETDLPTVQANVTYNKNTVICNNYITIAKDMDVFATERHEDGIIEGDFLNTNINVDGLPGKNSTHVYFDQTKEDWTPPTIQMLLFKDKNDIITDRFSDASDGKLEFAAGDFNCHPLPHHVFFFDCKEQTVDVSYSPYNANKWTTLDVEEIPSMYYMPGFGYFYRGELKNVNAKAKKGWFDLKIKLTDKSGNYHEQLISPAFRIDSLVDTGVDDLNVDNAVEVSRYSVDGQILPTKQKGINIVKYSNGEIKKVIVR
jgi:hypothetical protein